MEFNWIEIGDVMITIEWCIKRHILTLDEVELANHQLQFILS